ncbi:S-adenosyl-L-methionine-dependent methyltransferase [Stachybotrys elegans]|uniref:S-adenosyl-L-methionine-dependent methyltransferase n=1 Tax=Stachybotrys elegans TaxID=80388 RepID=A0A8K0STB0_9HYPO|nr:S-adenosyl-L-methionine-dependent methyltransferase [Stachybotrys elegans]
MVCLANDDKLSLAPLENPQKVLDIGTGTGIWAINFAKDFRSCELSWVPPNCHFELDNCELEWTFGNESLGYVHIRGMVDCIQDWRALYREACRCLKPSGRLEHTELFPDDRTWHTLGQVFREASENMGRTFEATLIWEQWIREAGFSGIVYKEMVKLSINDWANERKWKEVGLFNRASLEQGLEGFASYIFTALLGWQKQEVDVLLAKVRLAIKDRLLQAYCPQKIIYVQKPLRRTKAL